jgi:flagellar biosynthesis/type III secretory pathway chaperone
MVATNRSHELLNALEDVLVREFRLSQNLSVLTKEERNALMIQDVTSLLTLVERKEALLDELGQLDDSRRMIIQETSALLDIKTESPSVADIISVVDADTSTRFSHLREGILALMNDVRDLTQGNRVLATSGLERVDAVQAFLLNLFRSPEGYKPHNAPVSREPFVAFEIDQII